MRGWSGDRREGAQAEGRGEGGTFEGIFPFTASAPLIFSLLSACPVPDLQLDPAEVGDDIQSADKKLKVAVDHFKRGKRAGSCYGRLLSIKLSPVFFSS